MRLAGIVTLGVLLALAHLCSLPAADDGAPTVNLGRLSIARVSASSVNGNREMANEFYGVRNLFDGGSHIINNINYTYWLTDGSSRHWVRVRFPDTLVEVDQIIVETTPEQAPSEFAVRLTSVERNTTATTSFDSVKVGGFRTVYDLPEPQGNVREVVVVFSGSDNPSMIEVSEIEIMGRAAVGTDLRPVGPYIDVDETEVHRVCQRIVEDYVRAKYGVASASPTAGGWAYTVTYKGRELLRVTLDDKGRPLELVDLESDVREELHMDLNTG